VRAKQHICVRELLVVNLQSRNRKGKNVFLSSSSTKSHYEEVGEEEEDSVDGRVLPIRNLLSHQFYSCKLD